MLLLIKSPSFALEKPLVLYEAGKWFSFFCLFSGVGFLEDFSLRSPLPNASVQDFFRQVRDNGGDGTRARLHSSDLSKVSKRSFLIWGEVISSKLLSIHYVRGRIIY